MIDVCCAIIRNDDSEILVVQRDEQTDHPLKWEFPGGKIKESESADESIIREVDEELSMDIVITDQLSVVEYDYGIKQVRLFPFVCDTLSDEPVLIEHIQYKWVEPAGLQHIDLCEADILVAREYLDRYNPHREGIGMESRQPNHATGQQIREMLTERGGYDACDILAENIIENQEILDLMVDYSFSEDKQLAFRASYCITRAEEKVPGITEKYYGFFAESLMQLDNESVIRAFLKILNTYDFNKLNEDHHGFIADSCFGWLNSGKSSIAIKAYSMDALYKLSVIYPELVTELRSSILRVIEDGSAGIKARGKQLLKLLPS
ncbi:MAG: (deoxy)nucleoside triphosphate pyrophosphohydrolase [Bacteroidales bacterium]|nr:(deoxy)nucleoside triphosphate pyrophosphohydrolase [Bacteroidales bacterium]